MSKPILGLDLDGVLYPWQQAAFDHLVLFHNYTGTYQDLFDKESEFRKSKPPLFFENLIRVENLYYKYFPETEIIEFLTKLSKKYKIYYITSRPRDVEFVTLKYLTDFKFPYNLELVMTTNKKETVQELGCNWYVEDQCNNARSLKNITKVILFAQPWNYECRKEFDVIYSIFELEKFLK